MALLRVTKVIELGAQRRGEYPRIPKRKLAHRLGRITVEEPVESLAECNGISLVS